MTQHFSFQGYVNTVRLVDTVHITVHIPGYALLKTESYLRGPIVFTPFKQIYTLLLRYIRASVYFKQSDIFPALPSVSRSFHLHAVQMLCLVTMPSHRYLFIQHSLYFYKESFICCVLSSHEI